MHVLVHVHVGRRLWSLIGDEDNKLGKSKIDKRTQELVIVGRYHNHDTCICR